MSGLTHFQTVIAGVSAAGVSATGAWLTIRNVAKFTKPWRDFFVDWNGEPARPGVQRRPPVMERLAALDDGQLHIIERLKRVETQQTPNGGGSMRDEIQQIKQAVTGPPQ